MDLCERFDAGLSAPVEEDWHKELRMDPQDGHKYKLEELCKKYAATRSRFDAEQYFCSHCWCTDSSKCPETFAFDGLWTYSSGSLKLGDGAICWQSGLVTHINATSDIAFDMELDGEIFQVA
ncbi:unnamed protein product [Durusdinium trenchii]|uniref:Uncharacterized protein n=1 Tax=Durusdinium trenchii TaxID=1381693 RepID=A0ABP0MUC5_9DINO